MSYQLRLFGHIDYIDRFDQEVKKQFLQADIVEPPTKVLSLEELSNLDNALPAQDLERFQKILTFKAKRNEDPSEYALAWLLDAEHIGGSQKKADIVLQCGEGISIKASTLNSKKKVKFGRIGSSSSYKDLMSLWSFYVTYLKTKKQDLIPTRISRKQVNNLDLKASQAVKKFLEVSSRSINVLYSQDEQGLIEEFVNKLISSADSINEKIVELINSSFKECLQGDVNHLIVIDKDNLKVRILEDINKEEYVNNFFSTNFGYIAGNEMWIEVNK